jgi:hypothetical protein
MSKTGIKSLKDRISTSIMAGLLLAGAPALAAETQLTPEPDTAPTLTVEQPTNPVSSKPGGPILVSMSVRLGPTALNMVPKTIIPEFHFVAPHGNAVLLHRDMIETSANNFHLNPATAINVPADVQKKGAVLSGGWQCNQGQYYATVSAYIMDADGNRSNAIKYTVHCNGG